MQVDFNVSVESAASAQLLSCFDSAWHRPLSVGSSNKVFRILMNFMQIDKFSLSLSPRASRATFVPRRNGNAIDDRREEHYNAENAKKNCARPKKEK
jgi:hypothetical protein